MVMSPLLTLVPFMVENMAVVFPFVILDYESWFEEC